MNDRDKLIEIIVSCGNMSEGVLADVIIDNGFSSKDASYNLLELVDIIQKHYVHKILDTEEQRTLLNLLNTYRIITGIKAEVKGSDVYLKDFLISSYDSRADDYAFTRAREFAENYNRKLGENK